MAGARRASAVLNAKKLRDHYEHQQQHGRVPPPPPHPISSFELGFGNPPSSPVPSRSVANGPLARLFSSTPVPATLQACREARNLKLYARAFCEIDAEGRYVWVNWDMDIISIGTSYFEYFHPPAPPIKRFKFERANSESEGGFFSRSEVKELDAFVNIMEIFVVCADGGREWHGALEDHHSHWRCGEENVYLIDPYGGIR
ncbi:hypothetical protein N657DRAFT_675269 [Parathielavia appendiculata]|uniref:2EXR domain-containing protein n=1 Tax=Parathielavia appendiculata TaxID=2587402 RepID=A0AAN6TQR3_9PEZI|nr:hypothetical protein N657DRAFT_675269 [Parathielavia appendiculata]